MDFNILARLSMRSSFLSKGSHASSLPHSRQTGAKHRWQNPTSSPGPGRSNKFWQCAQLSFSLTTTLPLPSWDSAKLSALFRAWAIAYCKTLLSTITEMAPPSVTSRNPTPLLAVAGRMISERGS